MAAALGRVDLAAAIARLSYLEPSAMHRGTNRLQTLRLRPVAYVRARVKVWLIEHSAPDGPTLFVAVRGSTACTSDALINLNIAPRDASTLNLPGRAHAGYADACKGLLPSLLTSMPLVHMRQPMVFVGHSMGGACAYLLAGQLAGGRGGMRELLGAPPSVITFGAPPVGDLELATALGAAGLLPDNTRVVHRSDPVPDLPKALASWLCHPPASCELLIAGPGSETVMPYAAHRMRTYSRALCAQPRCPLDVCLRSLRGGSTQ